MSDDKKLLEDAERRKALGAFIEANKDRFPEDRDKHLADLPENLLVEEPVISIDDVIGQEEAVKYARKFILRVKNKEFFEQYKVPVSKGVIFSGVPGTGKTMLAQAIASETDSYFYNVSSQNFATKYINEGSNNLQKIFDNAGSAIQGSRSQYNSYILFFDEFDNIAGSRGESHKEDAKIVNTLNENIDGMYSVPGVYVIGATNFIDSIDDSIKSRLDIIRFKTPEKEDLALMYKSYIQKWNAGLEHKLFYKINCSQLGRESVGMTGRDIKNILVTAAEDELYEIVNPDIRRTGIPNINNGDLLKVIKSYKANKYESKKNIGFE